MKINRLDSFNIISALILIGLILFVVRTQWGADLSLTLGSGGYVVDASGAPEAVGSNRETIVAGDRVLTIAGRRVNSLADVGDTLRKLDADPVAEPPTVDAPTPSPEAATVPIILERRGYQFTETLTSDDVKANGLPKSIDAGDRVIAYGDHEVGGELNRDEIISLLGRHNGAPVTFKFLRPVHQYTANLPLRSPSGQLWPVLMFLIALVAVQGAAWRRRTSHDGLGDVGSDGDPSLRSVWLRFSWAAVAAPWGLVVLTNPAMALRDPLLLLPALLGLAMFRPLSLDLHQRLRGGHVGHPLVAVALFVPAALLALVGGEMALSLMPSLWDGQVSPDEEGGIANFLRVAAAMIALYHILDMVLWFRTRWQRDAASSEPMAWTGPEVGLLASSVALLTALLVGVADGTGFFQGNFIYHAAGLMLVLWIGDLTLLAWPPGNLDHDTADVGMDLGRSRARIYDFMVASARHIKVDEVQLVVVHNRLALVMSEADEDEDLAARTLVIERADESLRAAVGLLRDEQVSLPLPPGKDRGRGEHQGVSSLGDDIAQSVVDTLDIRIAFCLLDEADNMTSPTHDQRDRAFFVYLIVHGEDGKLGGPEDIQALRQQFARVWPHSRQLLMDHVLNEAGSPTKPPSKSKAVAVNPAPSDARATEDEAPREIPNIPFVDPEDAANLHDAVEITPSSDEGDDEDDGFTPEALSPEMRELPFLRRDLAMIYPIHELDLLEPALDRASRDLARNDAPIILVGSSGSGKEFLARRIHALGANSRGPFIKFAVSGCPPSLWELEMFGDADAYGHLTASLSGTLFVEDASMLEDKLLDRLLQELGQQPEPIRLILSIRLMPEQTQETYIAEAPGLLGELVRGFLARQLIAIPPLHERPELVQRIADHYMMQWAMKHNRVITAVDPRTIAALRHRRWAAGVAELKMLLEAAVLRCDGQTLLPEHLIADVSELPLQQPAAVARPVESNGAVSEALKGGLNIQELARSAPNLQEFLQEVQATVYHEALDRERGDRTAAARLMGVKRSTYVRRLKQSEE